MTDLPNGWTTKSLRDWGMQAQSGFASGVHNSEGNGVIHLRPMNVSRLGKLDFDTFKSVEDDSSRRITKGDILFNNTNSAALVGKTALVDIEGDFAFSNHMTRLRFPPETVAHKYMAILLHSFWMSGYFNEICSNHVNQASVSIKRLEQVEVSLPSIHEQYKIVEILEEQLSRLDAALTDAKQAKIKSAQFRRSLLQAAFTGNLENYATSPMTELPDGWRQERFGDIFKIKYGKAIDKSVRMAIAEYPVVGSAGVMTYTKTPLTTEPTIVIGRKGNVGSIQIFKEGCYPIDTTYYMSTSSEFDIDFLTYLLTSLELVKLDSSTATPSLRREDLENVLVVVPPINEQYKIVALLEHHLSRLDASVSLAHQMDKQSAALRRSLLQFAFTGQLTKEVTSV